MFAPPVDDPLHAYAKEIDKEEEVLTDAVDSGKIVDHMDKISTSKR